jgi:hypothetical protein
MEINTMVFWVGLCLKFKSWPLASYALQFLAFYPINESET